MLDPALSSEHTVNDVAATQADKERRTCLLQHLRAGVLYREAQKQGQDHDHAYQQRVQRRQAVRHLAANPAAPVRRPVSYKADVSLALPCHCLHGPAVARMALPLLAWP